MDTSPFCNSTSTSAPVKLGLCLPVIAFRFDMILISLKLHCLWSVHKLQLHALTAGGTFLYENPGARECTFNLRISAQLRTLWRFKNTFPCVHESGGDLFYVGLSKSVRR